MKQLILQQVTVEDLVDQIASKLERDILSKVPLSEEQERYLTRKETAQLLKVSLVTLNEWSKEGRLQSYKIGGRVRYKTKEIDEALGIVKNRKYRRS